MEIGWFSSGRDEAARRLFEFIYDKIQNKELYINIKFVFSNREEGEGEESDLFLEAVRESGIAAISFSSSKFRPDLRKKDITKWREEYDREVYKLISNFVEKNNNLSLLSGYMLIVSRYLCNKLTLINLHPDIPGRYTGSWQSVIREIIKNKDMFGGAMMHRVTEELDRGPCITWTRFKIKDYDFESIRQEELRLEFPLIYHTLRLISENKIDLNSNKIKPRFLPLEVLFEENIEG